MDINREIIRAKCDCKAGARGQCKHAAAFLCYVNSEESATQTSQENKWKRPSAKQLKMYTKGIVFQEMHLTKETELPPRCQIQHAIFQQNCAFGITLRATAALEENRTLLKSVLPNIGKPSPLYASQCNLNDISDFSFLLDDDECDALTEATVQQSLCPEWHAARGLRISASSKAHRIRIREADFESLADDLTMRKFFTNEACRYGQAMEAEAREAYEKIFSHKVVRMGLAVCKTQPWLCCSLDGFVLGEEKLLEIKCPYTCKDKPICCDKGYPFVKYIEVIDGSYRLRNNRPYYTQVQVCMYVMNVNLCDFLCIPLQDTCAYQWKKTTCY